MNPYNHLASLDNYITHQQNKLKFSRDKPGDTRLINQLILARNGFESMLKDKYFTEAIEVLILDKMLSVYRKFDISQGGDIDEAEYGFMTLFSNLFTLGLKSKKELVKEELKMYLDFHAIREGDWSDEHTDAQKKAYLTERNNLINKQLNERITTIKQLILFSKK